MRNLKLFNETTFSLPKTIDKEYFPDYVAKIFDEYFKQLLLFEGELKTMINQELPAIKKLSNQIKKAIDEYYLGDTVKAYNQLGAGLKAIQPYLTTKGRGISSDSFLSLYRSRIGGNKIYSLDEMFHIPFELRQKVSSQRFSIPGLPCLYLGNSIYMCWEELGRPDINAMQISRLEIPRGKLILLDFALTPSHIYHVFSSFEAGSQKKVENQWLLDQLIKWPLIFTSTLKVKDRTASFKPEYIIPQLLLQWVSNNEEVDGIIYFSSRVDSDFSKYNGANINYVIPVKTHAKNGFCVKLQNDFKITEPVSWQLFNLGKPAYTIEHKDVEMDNWIKNKSLSYPGPEKLELIKGIPQQYSDTIFGILEIILNNSAAKQIHNDE